MSNSYKNAMNKIKADDGFKDQLKARLVREEQRLCRVSASRGADGWTRLFAVLTTAAVLLITVFSAALFLPDFLQKRTATTVDTEVPAAPEVTVTVPEDMVVFTGNNSICLARDLSLRYTAEDAIKYDTNIFFTFEGFEKYDIPITGSCIVFETALAPSYTVSNFFEDYYNLIVNSTGVSTINNGVLESFFNIADNGIRTFSVYDGERELIDLDTALMSEYIGKNSIHFTIVVS